MAGELRKAAGLRLAPVSTTAAFAKSAIAERAKARRQGLETQAPMQPAPAAAPAPSPRPPVAAPAVVAPSPSPPAVAAPPPRPAPPPEPDLEPQPELDALLESDVLVAPGLRAPVADVVELGSDALLDSSDSIPPAPAASGAVMLNPFALRTGPPHPPPPAFPPPAPPPIVEAVAAEPPPAPPRPPPVAAPPVLDVAFTPVVEAKPAVPEEPVLPPRAHLETQPSLTRLSELDAATRRRKVLVLGGVMGLGGLILVLALVRWATRDTGTHESPRPPSVAQIAPSAPPPPTTPVATTPPPRPTPAPVPPPVSPPAAAPTAAPVVAPTKPPPAAKPPAPPPVAAAARPKPPAPSHPAAATPPRPKKAKPAFDPNTL